MAWDQSVFYRELQKHYGILPYSPIAIPMDWYLSVFYQELQNNYNPCHTHWWPYRRIHRQMAHIPKCMIVRLPGRSAQLPTNLPTDAANPMRPCSHKHLLTNLLTDVEKSGGIFKILVWKSIKYRRKLLTEFNATAQKNIILFSIGNSVGKIVV